jgi:putative phosphoribosyl transferase
MRTHRYSYRDRGDAGRSLAQALLRLREQRPIVLALPRGGVPVGFEVAKALHCPLDIVSVRKLGAPGQPELAVGAVVDTDPPETVGNADVMQMLGLDQAWLDHAAKAQHGELARRRALYVGQRARPALAGRHLIVVDDGIATGASIRAALKALRRAKPARLILAVPVAPAEIIEQLAPLCDEIVCPHQPEDFGAVGYYYDDFRQVEDAEVVELLTAANQAVADAKPA